MKKIHWNRLVAISTVFFAMQVAAQDVALNQPVIQRSFLNLGFEEPVDLSKRNQDTYGCVLNGGQWTNSYCVFNQSGVVGWKTTAGTQGSNSRSPGREIELWKQGGSGDNVGVTPHQGSIYAELNAHVPAALYQNVCVSEEDKLTWSLWHRARALPNATALPAQYQKIKFFIGDGIPDNSPLQSTVINVAGKNYLSNQEPSAPKEFSSSSSAWTRHYSPAPVALSAFLGGKKAAVKSFGFEAALFYDGNGRLLNTPDRGNLLDNIVLDLNPAIEFSAESGSVVESAEGTKHIVKFNVVGTVTGNIDVRFIINKTKLNTNEKLATLRTAANPQGDFKIYDVNTGQEINVVEDGNLLRFTYTLRYDASLRNQYPKGVTINGLAIEVFNNSNKEGHRIIPFELDPVQTGLQVMDLKDCGENVFDGFKYEIQDDDVDLVIEKKLLEDAPIPSLPLHYEITLFNDSQAAAKDVVLKDQLLSNLTVDAQNTRVTCEALVDDRIEACPITLSQSSVGQLFGQGLNIGNMAGKARYRFQVSNLKLANIDSSAAPYVGYLANEIRVSTSSNDINLDNNVALAKNLYPTRSDLMNNTQDTARSGAGLFVIHQNGLPLLTKEAQNKKAYFPLVVKNEAKTTQDYQLYSSAVEILRTRSNELFSPLQESSIQPFNQALRVEFFEVNQAQCDASLSGKQQITQLMQVAANEVREYCAVVTLYDDAQSLTSIWFAIESMQSKLGDVILNAVSSIHRAQRDLSLTNDQEAQVNVGGSYVFSHLLSNKGKIQEKSLKISLQPLNVNDGFIYTLFVDENADGLLDAKDTQIRDTDRYQLNVGQEKALLVKVQTPSTAQNGMSSQVQIVVTPDNTNQSFQLNALRNNDLIVIGSNQLAIQKMQFKQPQCQNMNKAQILTANYQLQGMQISASDCVIYRISVKNIGAHILTNIRVNDMYPAYTRLWQSGTVLPMIDDDQITPTVKGREIDVVYPVLRPNEQKNLYFGVRLE